MAQCWRCGGSVLRCGGSVLRCGGSVSRCGGLVLRCGGSVLEMWWLSFGDVLAVLGGGDSVEAR
jgi:hypothetical protein